MDTPIEFPDPQLAVRDLLRVVLANDDLGENATVSTRGIPGADESRSFPYIQVRSDGSFRDARLNGRATVRVLVYHEDEGKSQALALRAEARLLAASSDKVRGCSPVTGPLPPIGGDPDTGDPLSYFTITARLRPRQL